MAGPEQSHELRPAGALDRRPACTRGGRQLVTISPDATVSAAIQLLQSVGISQLPVLQDGKPVGSVQEVTLARVLHDDQDPNKVKIGDVMARPLPQLDVSVHLDEA